ncbi:MAG: 2-hydroxyacid dehydrogenase [Candidatus Geothermarchaeales archaeon]
MRRPRVFVTRAIPEEPMRLLRGNLEVDAWPQEDLKPSREEIIEHIRDKEGILTLLTDEIDAEVMDSAPNLKIIANYAVGYDNIDVKAASERGILVTNTPEVLTETVADLTFALILSVARGIVKYDALVRGRGWKGDWKPMLFLGSDVHGKTLGIVGLGRIGEAVARRARGFDMRILYFDIVRRGELEGELGVEYVSLEELLRASDYVSLHVPLMRETRHMMGEEEFNLMKATAYLINTSRGPVVDEEALYKALKERRIAGAALDVFEVEPLSDDNPLLELENVVLTPHIGSASPETRIGMGLLAAEALVDFLARKRAPRYVVNPEVLRGLDLKREA